MLTLDYEYLIQQICHFSSLIICSFWWIYSSFILLLNWIVGIWTYTTKLLFTAVYEREIVNKCAGFDCSSGYEGCSGVADDEEKITC
jgi:hypothetical protein